MPLSRRVRLPASTVLDATGAGTVSVTARADLMVTHLRVTVGPAPGQTKVIKQPSVTVQVEGEDFESTHSGARDQSDTQYELAASESVTCEWTGGDPGATATMYLRGVWL